MQGMVKSTMTINDRPTSPLSSFNAQSRGIEKLAESLTDAIEEFVMEYIEEPIHADDDAESEWIEATEMTIRSFVIEALGGKISS